VSAVLTKKNSKNERWGKMTKEDARKRYRSLVSAGREEYIEPQRFSIFTGVGERL